MKLNEKSPYISAEKGLSNIINGIKRGVATVLVTGVLLGTLVGCSLQPKKDKIDLDLLMPNERIGRIWHFSHSDKGPFTVDGDKAWYDDGTSEEHFNYVIEGYNNLGTDNFDISEYSEQRYLVDVVNQKDERELIVCATRTIDPSVANNFVSYFEPRTGIEIAIVHTDGSLDNCAECGKWAMGRGNINAIYTIPLSATQGLTTEQIYDGLKAGTINTSTFDQITMGNGGKSAGK